VVFHDFPGAFYVRFPGLSRTIHVHFHVFSGLFNRVDIEQVSFSHTCFKSVNESTKHVAHNIDCYSSDRNVRSRDRGID